MPGHGLPGRRGAGRCGRRAKLALQPSAIPRRALLWLRSYGKLAHLWGPSYSGPLCPRPDCPSCSGPWLAVRGGSLAARAWAMPGLKGRPAQLLWGGGGGAGRAHLLWGSFAVGRELAGRRAPARCSSGGPSSALLKGSSLLKGAELAEWAGGGGPGAPRLLQPGRRAHLRAGATCCPGAGACGACVGGPRGLAVRAGACRTCGPGPFAVRAVACCICGPRRAPAEPCFAWLELAALAVGQAGMLQGPPLAEGASRAAAVGQAGLLKGPRLLKGPPACFRGPRGPLASGARLLQGPAC